MLALRQVDVLIALFADKRCHCKRLQAYDAYPIPGVAACQQSLLFSCSLRTCSARLSPSVPALSPADKSLQDSSSSNSRQLGKF
jgi:hypothetical protein